MKLVAQISRHVSNQRSQVGTTNSTAWRFEACPGTAFALDACRRPLLRRTASLSKPRLNQSQLDLHQERYLISLL